jgi:hypothetical protein
MSIVQPLSSKQVELFAIAITNWQNWRGSLTGHPDPKVLKEFDRQIKEADEALIALRRQQKLLRACNKEISQNKNNNSD